MATRGRILIADDEPTFLTATADLLRREGYEVDTVPDGGAALEQVALHQYDLLISDLEMPGNEELRLVREVGQVAGGLPVIIITGFPSTRSAIASIELPVSAYLLKPVQFPDLLQRIENAVQRFRSYRTMREAETRMSKWREDFDQLSASRAASAGAPPSVDTFLALTLRNVMGSLSDLENLGHALTGNQVDQHACQLINCPRGSQLHNALREVIDVLEETKSSFKSKQLADLRKKLELLVDHV
ncbi:MAG: response regulator [Gemmatimonadales bacterium]|nr:response regulator [Gemmatimonadales bacterium]